MAVTVAAIFAAGLVGILALPIAEVMIAYAPGAVDAMMLLALALNLDPVYVGAHHLVRIFFVSLAMPLVARRAARPRKSRGRRHQAAAQRPPFRGLIPFRHSGRREAPHSNLSCPAKRGIQYAAALEILGKHRGCWITRFRGQ